MKLNGATIPDEIVRRVVERRGAEHCFADLDPARTALVVIDLQHAFMNEAVGHAVVPAARDIVPAVNRLAAAVRRAGGGVFWVQMTHDDNCLDDWSVAFEMSTPAMREKRIAALSEGGLGHQLWPDLDVKPEDEIVKKYRYSGFLPGTSDLADRLRARGFDTVLITGTVTNVCCESSARDANMMNFRTVMVSDGNAALTQAEHDAVTDRVLRDLWRCHGHRDDHRRARPRRRREGRLRLNSEERRRSAGSLPQVGISESALTRSGGQTSAPDRDTGDWNPAASCILHKDANMCGMITTVDIPDELFRRVKSQAALRGRKLKDLVEEGLRLVLEKEPARPLKKKRQSKPRPGSSA